MECPIFGIKPFLCEDIDKTLLRNEWERWLRSFKLYLESEEITNVLKKRNKLLHLGGSQLQEVIYNIPGALPEYNKEKDNDVFAVLVEKLNDYFSPDRNSSFERHLYRDLSPSEGEDLSKFLLRLRQQAARCFFGNNKDEILEIMLKDKLIDVWAPAELKKRLLEKEYTLEQVLNLCKVHEQVSSQTNSMKTSTEGETISQIFNSRTSTKGCYRCGQLDHFANNTKCPARNVRCNKCSKQGHFARQCKTGGMTKRKLDDEQYLNSKRFKRENKNNRIRCVADEAISVTVNEETEGDQMNDFDCFNVTEDMKSVMEGDVVCKVGGVAMKMLIDSGSKLNLISESDFHKLMIHKAVLWNIRSHTVHNFKSYASDIPLKVRNVFESPIAIQGVEIISTFFVIEGAKQSLLGKDSAIKLKVLRLGFQINQVDNTKASLPAIKGVQVTLSIDRSVRPVTQALRRVPIALEPKVEERLKEALEQGIIEPVVGPCNWLSPVVIVAKNDGTIRLCIDMRRANLAIKRENFPFPTFETIAAKLRGAKYFTRLDLKNAYHQLELEEGSREITTFITHKGIYRYKRLFFGVNSAPEIFQKTFENLLAPAKGAMNYLDDIIVTGSTEAEHDDNLKTVLKIFEDYGVTLNNDKCVYKATSLKFLGHILSSEGINPDPDKVNVIVQFREPNTKEELRSFLGLATYLAKFIADFSDLTAPLRDLLKNDIKLKTRLITDASPVALGAVLLQLDGDKIAVISFASRSLSEVEQKYSQTEKEGLGLVWGVERFYYYLAGIHFELETDHKPLEAIFKPTSRPPARIERWVMRLQSFSYKIVYKAGKYNIADSLSRLCSHRVSESFDKHCEANIYAIVEAAVPTAVSITEVVQASAQDPDIQQIITNIQEDTWANNTKSPYYPFRLELSLLGNVVLRSNRLVIPKQLRVRILELTHEGHPGESMMKRRIRARVWWPAIDRDVEQFVKNCRDCLIVSQPNVPAPMSRHVFPDKPWKCLAIDILGPLPNNDYVLVVIDYYSRYVELKFLKSIKSSNVIQFLDEIFCRHGFPDSIKADNGRQFVSDEFKNYCKQNNIKLITSPPYWPQANGEVENMNRSLVKRLKIAHANKSNYKEEIQKFLLMYHVTPHGTTGATPSELLFKRVVKDKVPSVFDMVNINGDSHARDVDMIRKQKGKEREDGKRRAKECGIAVGDKVLLQNMTVAIKLTPTFDSIEYTVSEIKGNEAIVTGDGKTYRRNVSHIKKINQLPSSATPDSDVMIQPMKLRKIGGMWQPVNGNLPTEHDVATCV